MGKKKPHDKDFWDNIFEAQMLNKTPRESNKSRNKRKAAYIPFRMDLMGCGGANTLEVAEHLQEQRIDAQPCTLNLFYGGFRQASRDIERFIERTSDCKPPKI